MVFKMMFDGADQVVEAPSMTKAIEVWRAYNVKHCDMDPDAEPDSCELITINDAIRWRTPSTKRE